MKFITIFVCLVLLPSIFAIKGRESATLKGAGDGTPCPSKSDPRKFLHCPHDNAVCCSTGDWCCPQSYTCGVPGKCDKSNDPAADIATKPQPPQASQSPAMQQILQSASQVPAPPVSSASAVGSESSATSMPGTNSAVSTNPHSMDLTPPRLDEDKDKDKSAIVILKNVNTLYKGPPKNGVIQPVTEKEVESSEHSSGSF